MSSPSSGQPLRFAIVGCGSIARTHVNALRALPDGLAEVVVCCDLVDEQAAAFAEEFGLRRLPFDEMLADENLDAVSFCTPSGLHAGQGVAAMNAGKHVIVEKPMDISLKACDALLSAQRASGKQLAVVSQHRFDPASRRVAELLKTGQLGELYQAEARIPWYRTQGYYDSGEWRGTVTMDGGGCVMNQGIHTVDLLRWFCGAPEKVFAYAGTRGHAGIEVEDALCGVITFANGVLASVTASTCAYPGFPASISLYGSKGSVVIEADELRVLALEGKEKEISTHSNLHALQVASGGTKLANENAGTLKKEEGAMEWGAAHRLQFLDFVKCCLEGGTPVVDGVEGRNAVELVLALYESARSGCEVRISAKGKI